nr:glutamate receptor 3-like protein 0 [Pomacea canaliculata]
MTPEEVHWDSSILKLKENADSVIDEHLDIQNKTPDSFFFLSRTSSNQSKRKTTSKEARERKKKSESRGEIDAAMTAVLEQRT